MMKKKLDNIHRANKFIILLLIFIFGGFVGCSIGTDESISSSEKSSDQLRSNTGETLFASKREAPAKAILTEGSGIKTDGHPQVDENKIIFRKTFVPPEVKNRWKAVRILVQNKKEEKEGIQVVDLGTSVALEDSGLKVTVGPFLPNFMMDKMTYTSVGNEQLNPAVQLIVEDGGKIIYKGWAFKKFPTMYAFEHQIFSVKLLGAIPAAIS